MQKNIHKFIRNNKRDSNLRFLKLLEKKLPDAEIYLVGGMVRDIALGRSSKDYDFVIRNVRKSKLEIVEVTLALDDFILFFLS